MRHIYKCLMVMVILVSILIFVFASIKDVSSQSLTPSAQNSFLKSNYGGLVLKEDDLQVTDIVSINSKYPLNKMYIVGEEKANLFSLSYAENHLQKGSTIELNKNNKNISNQIYFILEKSYPNVSLEEMGLDTEEEAYQAEQLAIWEVAYRTKESRYGSELSRIESIKSDMGNRNINIKVFDKAEQLRDSAIQYSVASTSENQEGINDNLELNIDNAQDRIFNLEVNGRLNYAVGPITYKVDTEKLVDSQIIITDSFGNILNGKIVDLEGIEVESVKPDTEYYVTFSNYPGEAVTITVNANCKIFMPSVYEYEGADYIANTYSNKEISNSITVGF